MSTLLLSCSSLKEINTESSKTVDSTVVNTTHATFNIQLKIQRHFPYCGGAAPTEDMLNNYSPVSGNFILIEKQTATRSTVISKNGIIQLQLKPGQYSIRETFKDIPFDVFYAKHAITDRTHYQNDSEECYKRWWKTNLFEFEITDTTTFLKYEKTLYSRCFTGNNPCLQYSGPYPP